MSALTNHSMFHVDWELKLTAMARRIPTEDVVLIAAEHDESGVREGERGRGMRQ